MRKSFVVIVVSFWICLLASQAWAVPAAPVMTYATNGLDLSINWTTVPDATGYTLHYAPFPYTGPDSINSKDLGSSTSFNYTLWEDAAFYITVTAYDDTGESVYSNVEHFSVTTHVPPEEPIFFTNVNGTSLSVTWIPVPNATGYKLNYLTSAYTGQETLTPMDLGDASSFSYGNLKVGITYTIALQAYNEYGESVMSTFEIFTVQEQDESPPPLKGMVYYSDTPVLNEEVTISLVIDEELQDIKWEIMNRPINANINLILSEDAKSVTFVPDVVGDYELKVSSVEDDFGRTAKFTITPNLPFDTTKIEVDDPELPIDQVIGVIKNQSWVHSSVLSEAELKTIVSHYSDFTILGFDDIQGLLVEYDEKTIELTGSLEALRQEDGIKSVVNRVFEGENAPRDLSLFPSDGIAFFNGGGNWHLEATHMVDAWPITTGSTHIRVGISDSGYDTSHSELSGRVSELLSSSKSWHGNCVAGTIGALTDNGQGMSGINWVSQMVLGEHNGYYEYLAVLSKDVVIVNGSWAMTGIPPKSFDPSDQTSVATQDKHTLDKTRAYRKLAQSFGNKLQVWAAGNGIDNGKGNKNGVVGINGRHDNPAMHYSIALSNVVIFNPLDNVIFVAALEDENRLAFYSNYGKSVDIAAPTNFISLTVDQKYKYFEGTSAAAPVVTGVASLIYSIYPGFTAKEVKDILINSSTETVNLRRKALGDDGPFLSNLEVLEHPIPVLNAAKALELAKSIYENIYAPKEVVAPIFSLVSGTYSSPQSVSLSTSTDGATIRYTTDGSVPKETSALYSSPIVVSNDMTILARAFKGGWLDSGLAEETYIIANTVATPFFSPPPGSYSSVQNVSLSTSTHGATIHYTTDGKVPTETSATYSSPIVVSKNMNFRARAFKDGMVESDIAEGIYTVKQTNTYTMSGTIHSGSASGPVLVGATVSIAGITTTTSSSGAFTISGIEAGTYAMSVSKSGYNTYTNPAYMISADKNNLNFYLTPVTLTYTMSGTIHSGSATGPVLSGATVSIAGISTTSSSTGAFTISGIEAGTYVLSVSKSGYNTYTNPSYMISADKINLNFYLTPATTTYAMSGTIHSESATGPVLAGATVSIAGISTTSSSSGAFTISGIEAGTYSLSVFKSGYKTYTNPAYMISADKINLNFYLTPATLTYTMSGTIHSGNAMGPVLSGATVSIAGTTATSDSSGAFTISGIGAGTYALSVSYEDGGYEIYTNTSYTVSSDMSNLNFFLTPETYTISGTVYSGSTSGPVLPNATVSIAGKSTTSNSTGAFTLSGIEGGVYTLYVSKNGYQSLWYPYTFLYSNVNNMNVYIVKNN